jgi:tetratricopeptide (TPR) repeat protein
VLTARLGADDPTIATVLHNIGGLAHAAGCPTDGEAAARRSVDIRDAALGTDHPDAAADRAALAAILAYLGRDDEARALLEAALAVFERALGANHHEVAVTLGSLAALDAKRGDLPTAERRLRRALPTRSEPSDTTTWSCRHASNPRRRPPPTGQRGRGRALYERALGLYESRGLEQHPHVAVLRASLCRAAELPRQLAPTRGAR